MAAVTNTESLERYCISSMKCEKGTFDCKRKDTQIIILSFQQKYYILKYPVFQIENKTNILHFRLVSITIKSSMTLNAI